MDTDFEFSEVLRDNVEENFSDVPLATHIWRLLRKQHAGRNEQLRIGKERDQKERRVLASIAMQVDRLHDIALRAEGPEQHRICQVAQALETALAEAGVTFLKPTGRPYTDELMDVIESVARVSKPGLFAPVVKEVIEPAIIVKDALMHMGKAVIAVPIWDEALGRVKDEDTDNYNK